MAPMKSMKAMKAMKTGTSLTKGGLADALSVATELKKGDCSKVLTALAEVVAKEVKKTGKVIIPGVARVVTRTKPATKAGKREMCVDIENLQPFAEGTVHAGPGCLASSPAANLDELEFVMLCKGRLCAATQGAGPTAAAGSGLLLGGGSPGATPALDDMG